MSKEDNNEDSKKLTIKVRPVKHRPEKSRLPGRIPPPYPAKLLAAFIRSDVLHALKYFATSEQDHELGGVLVGKIGRASRRPFVEILDFIPASKGVSRRASFEFTNEAQKEIHDIMADRFRGLRIVGWFHTHPGYGIFLSSADQFIDENYFNEKYHVAVVIDPGTPEVDVGAFVWNQDQQRVRVNLFEV
jgi:proteasome lid subunit RPN8/RPN11